MSPAIYDNIDIYVVEAGWATLYNLFRLGRVVTFRWRSDLGGGVALLDLGEIGILHLSFVVRCALLQTNVVRRLYCIQPNYG